jgi:hypothetical protein
MMKKILLQVDAFVDSSSISLKKMLSLPPVIATALIVKNLLALKKPLLF